MDKEKQNQNTEPQPIDNQTLPRFYGQNPGSSAPACSKMEWPELVGVKAEEAENKIKEEMEGAVIQVVQPGHFVTCDYRTNRVRLFVDSSGKIDRPPRIG